MRKLLISIVLVVGLLGCSTLGYKQAQLADVAWSEMCTLLETEEIGYLCKRVQPPLVVYEIMRPGLMGYYDGGDTVYIRQGLSFDEQLEVLIHEDVHYLHAQLQIVEIPGPAIEVCWSENEAWYIEGLWSGTDNSKWWRQYPYCWEWYADEQYLMELGSLYNIINGLVDNIIFETIE